MRDAHACMVLVPFLISFSLLGGCVASRTRFEQPSDGGMLEREGELAGDAQVGIWTYRYPGGAKKAEGRFAGDHQDGPWTYWYENGKKEMEGSFAEERRSGLWRYWYADGSLRAEGRFENDREDGFWTFWRPGGKRERSGSFDDGRLAGRWTYWDEDGRPRSSGHYLDGQKAGAWTFWDADGNAVERRAPVPEGYSLVEDRIASRAMRREGFIAKGKSVGRWETRHRSGEVRMCGNFRDGVPNGTWDAFHSDGRRFAFGPVDFGRLAGEWTVFGEGGASTLRPEGFLTPARVRGEWSDDSLSRERSPESVLSIWLAEASAPLDDDAGEEIFSSFVTEPLADVSADDPGAPTAGVQPAFTVDQSAHLERIVEGYSSGGLSYDDEPTHLPAISLISGGPEYSERDETRELPPGDEELARSFIDKPLPGEALLDPEGKPIDIAAFRGKKNVLLVILRGFDGRVCEYCAGQTMALGRSQKDFADRDTEVIAVYPGRRSRLEAFLDAYRSQFRSREPRFQFVYDPELGLANSLGIGPPEGKIARPTILLLDKSGIVRYAYVGMRKEDRPSVDRLLEEVDRLPD